MKTLAMFFVLLNSQAFCQELAFTNENIKFRLTRTYFYVDGTYWFVNLSDHETTRLIYYPLPTIDQSDTIDSVDIFNITEGTRPEISSKTKSGFSFILSLRNHDSVIYHIAYRQKVSGDSAVYILRSTQAWNQPLKSAEYMLHVDDAIDVTTFSYDPDKTYDIAGRRYYLWKRDDFMPAKDFVVHFKLR